MPKPPQLPKVPDANVFKEKNRSDALKGFGAGYASTILTGSTGTQTPSNQLGSTSLLGK